MSGSAKARGPLPGGPISVTQGLAGELPGALLLRMMLLLVLLGGLLPAQDAALIEKGRAESKRVCLPCHSMGIIQVQRLPRAAWDRILTKMAGWGTDIREREALLEYLVANYGPDKPPPVLPRSGDGTKK